MKWGFVFCVFMGSSLASATECPDMSGIYIQQPAEGVPTNLLVGQTDCHRMTMDFDYGHRMMVSRTLIFDGVQHLVFSSSEMRTYETAQINPSGVTYESIDEYLKENKKYLSKGSIVLDGSNQLIETIEIFDEAHRHLKTSKSVFKKK